MGRVLMSEWDVRRIEVLSEVLSGRRTVALAAVVLTITARQVNRLLIHKGRGQFSNHSASAGVREYVLELAKSRSAAGARLKNLLWMRFSDVQEQRANLPQPGQTGRVGTPSPNNAADRSAQHHGIHHPRTETKGIDRALEKMLVQKAHTSKQTRLKKMEDTQAVPTKG